MTTTFFCPPERIVGERLTLPADEARHAVQVLRHRTGDLIDVVDGQGGWYRVRLEMASGDTVGGPVLDRRAEVGEASFELILGFGMIKNANRLEFLVEKAVELGVRRLVPLETERTERTRLRHDRLERIAVAAMKQCGRSRLLQIEVQTPLQSFVESAGGVRLICHEGADSEHDMRSVLDRYPGDPLFVAIGPEGGFSDAEVALATSAGFRPVHLGVRRLRAETAGIVAAAIAMAHADPPAARIG